MSTNSTDAATGDLIPTEAGLDANALKALGLEPGDTAQIRDIAKSLADIQPGNLHVFGRDAATKSAALSTQLLDRVRNKDLDATGAKLGEVVRIARTLNLEKFGARSKVPFIGPVIDRLRASKGELVQKFSDTNSQIEQLLRDVSGQQTDLHQQVKDFDRMYDVVLAERRDLGLHVAAGKLRLHELRVEAATLVGAEDPQSRTRRSEVENAVRLLDKRVGDLAVMQHAADQALPMIRIIQTNSIQLIEKFTTVRDLTIPSWRRHFATQLSLEKLKSAAELTTAIDDATNEMMRRNADLVRETSVSTAKTAQRAVIDIETLRHVHDQLIKTVEDVREIHRDGMLKRQQAERELASMREDVQLRLANTASAP
jgi:uncharacterized protein YaaN involved in tellurite resistance